MSLLAGTQSCHHLQARWVDFLLRVEQALSGLCHLRAHLFHELAHSGDMAR